MALRGGQVPVIGEGRTHEELGEQEGEHGQGDEGDGAGAGEVEEGLVEDFLVHEEDGELDCGGGEDPEDVGDDDSLRVVSWVSVMRWWMAGDQKG